MEEEGKDEDVYERFYKEIDYGICGKRTYATIKLKNIFRETKTFAIVPKECGIYNLGLDRLTLYPEKLDIPPGKLGQFKFTYLPYLEDLTDKITYNILVSDKIKGILQVSAKSVGPVCMCETNVLKFLWFRNVNETTKHIEIKSSRIFEWRFCFDVDEDNQTFQISPLCGVVPGGVKLSVNFTFQPKQSGIYHKRVFCLFQFYNPIVLDLIGIYNPKLKLEKRKLSFDIGIPHMFSNFYELYMQKLQSNVVHDTERVSYSQKCAEECKKCLRDLITSKDVNEEKYQLTCEELGENDEEFDAASATKDNKQETKLDGDHIFLTNYFIDVKNMKNIPNATTLVNSSASKRYAYNWEHDYDNHFQVEPCKGMIFPNEKINFSLFFNPSIPDQLYHKEIDLRIFPRSEETEKILFPRIQLPLSFSLKIIGHSFLTDHCGWIPQCRLIPKNLQLSTCVPNEVTYGTFMIERQGHLPVNFVICLPKESNYKVQPPLGCICNDFQLFVVQFNGKLKEGLYVEDIKIVYNNLVENVDFIRLKTSVEIPKITFGLENTVKFDCTFPGSQLKVLAPMENCTNLLISYTFEIPEDISWIHIPEPSNIIESMSLAFVEIIFQPREPCEYEGQITCKVKSISKAADWQETITIELTGSCQFGYLIATPSIHDFGDCLYKENKQFYVHLFNFSPVVLHYKLVKECNKEAGYVCYPSDVQMVPDRGTIVGKGSTKVTIKIQVLQKGECIYRILCYIMNSDSAFAKISDQSNVICTIRLNCLVPHFQIVDLYVDNGGPIFSPDWLWKILCINRINQLLSSGAGKMTETIHLHLPEAMVGSPKLTINLLLEARFGDYSWKVKKTILHFEEEGEDRKEEAYEPGEAMTIIPMEAKLKEKDTLIMQIIVNYERVGKSKILWKFFLQHEKTISLHCTMNTFPKKEILPVGLLMHVPYDLKPVFVGDENPQIRLFWLYNNTPQKAFFTVSNVIPLESGNILTAKAFNFINPSETIPPFSCVPLKILFKPIEVKCYTVVITLIDIDFNPTQFVVTSYGNPNTLLLVEEIREKTIPEKSKFRNENIKLECSVNFINVNYMKPCSQVKRIFFIRNTSKKNTWAFQWHLFCIKDILTAHVEPSEGEIEPEEEAIMTLVLNSFGNPTRKINFSLPCDVIDYSHLTAHETYKRFFDSRNEKLRDYFTITEKGMTYDIMDTPEPEKPVSYHLYLAINTSIVSALHVDETLFEREELVLNASKEIEFRNNQPFKLRPNEISLFQNLLEKIIWDILNNDYFSQKCNRISKNRNMKYLQISTSSGRKKTASGRFLMLPKNIVQSFLEDMFQHIIYKYSRKKENLEIDLMEHSIEKEISK